MMVVVVRCVGGRGEGEGDRDRYIAQKAAIHPKKFLDGH